jgi:Domain of unknown function (DUF4265)
MPTEHELTKVHIDLPNHWATGGEALWAEALGNNRYRIENVPMYAYGLNYGDIVEAIPGAPDLKPSVIRVTEPSGHRTLRVFFGAGISREASQDYLTSLRGKGVMFERATLRYVALDLEPSANMNAVRDELDRWQAQDIAEYETCEARVDGSFDDVPASGSGQDAGIGVQGSPC